MVTRSKLDKEFLRQADAMPEEFLKCYVETRHRWSDDIWRYPCVGGYVVHKECDRCGKGIETTYEGGIVVARRYIEPDRPEQYGFTGLGHRTEQERAYLVESWLSLIPIKQVAAA